MGAGWGYRCEWQFHQCHKRHKRHHFWCIHNTHFRWALYVNVLLLWNTHALNLVLDYPRQNCAWEHSTQDVGITLQQAMYVCMYVLTNVYTLFSAITRLYIITYVSLVWQVHFQMVSMHVHMYNPCSRFQLTNTSISCGLSSRRQCHPHQDHFGLGPFWITAGGPLPVCGGCQLAWCLLCTTLCHFQSLWNACASEWKSKSALLYAHKMVIRATHNSIYMDLKLSFMLSSLLLYFH